MSLKALILEGGAMRSVHSAGALVALNELGFSVGEPRKPLQHATPLEVQQLKSLMALAKQA